MGEYDFADQTMVLFWDWLEFSFDPRIIPKILEQLFEEEITAEEYKSEIDPEFQSLVDKYGLEMAREYIDGEGAMTPDDFSDMFS